MFSKLLGNGDVGTMLEDGTYEPNESIRDRSIIPEVEKLVSGHSLEQDPVAIRVMRITLKPGSPKSITIEKDASEKVAAVADFITREYAKYQLSFLEGSADDHTIRLTLAQNASNV